MRSARMAAIPGLKKQWLEKFFRFGLISKGFVYCLLGLLTSLAAVGMSVEKASKKDAFNFIYQQPFGKLLLALIALGFFGYVTLRLFQTFKDINHEGNSAKGMVARIGYAISALVYFSLGLYATKLVLSVTEKGSNTQKFIVAKVLELDGGSWIIGIVALIIIISGGYQIYKGASFRFLKKIQLTGSRFSDVFRKAGLIGYISRGIVLLIIGYFLLHAALYKNAGKVQDTDGAFGFLESRFGSLIMAVVALGLVAYGMFMFVKAKYEQMYFKIN